MIRTSADISSNGRTGELLVERFTPKEIPLHHQSCRLVRAKLQSALLKKIEQRNIHLSKRLIEIRHLPSGRIRILFQDRDEKEVDLLVAADGIRSVGTWAHMSLQRKS